MAEHELIEAQHGRLVLSLSVSIHGSTAVIEAVLRNSGPEPWEYTIGGDLPPILQIEVHDAEGKEIYGWQRPFAAAHWQSIRTLEPGASIAEKAEVTARGHVYIRACVARPEGFQTKEIEVVLPASGTGDG